MNPVQFEAISKLMRMKESKAKTAARLVLVDGVKIGDAARQVGSPYKDAHQAVERVKSAIELAKVATGA